MQTLYPEYGKCLTAESRFGASPRPFARTEAPPSQPNQDTRFFAEDTASIGGKSESEPGQYEERDERDERAEDCVDSVMITPSHRGNRDAER
jgi:hypothetical protein